MNTSNSLAHRLGSLYCLYCLYETQPFKHPFKIYLSLGGLRRLKALVITANELGIKAASDAVRWMLENNMFLFGSVDISEYFEKDRIKQLIDVQNACIQKMHEKLLADTKIDRHLHLDLGREFDLDMLMKITAEYAGSKSLGIKGASQVLNVDDIRHLAEDRPTLGDEVNKINSEWDNVKETFSRQLATDHYPVAQHSARYDNQIGEVMLVPSPEQGLSEAEMQHPNFMELLMGDESPQANSNLRLTAPEANNMQDDDALYAQELENELFYNF